MTNRKVTRVRGKAAPKSKNAKRSRTLPRVARATKASRKLLRKAMALDEFRAMAAAAEEDFNRRRTTALEFFGSAFREMLEPLDAIDKASRELIVDLTDQGEATAPALVEACRIMRASFLVRGFVPIEVRPSETATEVTP
jgi:hypothetical protein